MPVGHEGPGAGPPPWFPGPAIDRTTREGWTRFRLTRDAFVPAPVMSYDEYKQLSPARQQLYDLHRIATCSSLPILDTPMTGALTAAVDSRLTVGVMGRPERTRAGLMVSGAGSQGKTESLCKILAAFEDRWLALNNYFNPDAVPGTRDLVVPVAYVQAPVTATPKSTCEAILSFYGEDFKGMNLPALGRTVRRALVEHATRVLVLDDITRLKLHREADQDALDLIRGFMDVTVLILVGVDIPHSGLLRGGRRDPRTGDWLFPAVPDKSKSPNDEAGTSTDRRFGLAEVDPFSYHTDEEIQAWVAHLAGLESHIRLLKSGAQPLTSGSMPEYLYQRTEGVVGRLSLLVSEACLAAIETGSEELTEELLASITVASGEVPGGDPLAGEEPAVAPPSPPAGRKGRKKRARNTVFDDHGTDLAAGM
jgi:AAA domain